MAELSLSNIINISVQSSPSGLGEYNTSNLALFSHEEPASPFADGYKIYLEPLEVATDFGSSSNTYKMALKVFSQNPNILANGGYLVVIPMVQEVQGIAFGSTPVSGSFVLNYGGGATAAIAYNDSASTIQTKLRAVAGLSAVVVTGSIPAGLSVSFAGVAGDISLLTVTSNTMVNGGASPVTVTVTETSGGETLDEAITRTADLVQYFGIMASYLVEETEGKLAAAVVQALNKILFLVGQSQSYVASSGYFDDIRSSSYDKTRCLLKISGTAVESLEFMAAYAGRGLSTVFSGSNTASTMHLKDLAGVEPDTGMTQTILNLCQDAGADVYASFQGVAKVFCSGANRFFDQVYNREWLVGALQVAGFNALAQSFTKLPQTENGISVLKSAYRRVMEQAVTCGYLAAGSWNSPSTFGNQTDFYNNIAEVGYYIYSVPVAQQSPADRADRKAPLIQIAAKEAGAVHSSSVIVLINE